MIENSFANDKDLDVKSFFLQLNSLQDIDAKHKAYVEKETARARASKDPDLKEAYTEVYVNEDKSKNSRSQS